MGVLTNNGESDINYVYTNNNRRYFVVFNDRNTLAVRSTLM